VDFAEIFSDAVVVAIGVNGLAYAMAGIGLNLHFGYTGLLNLGHAAFMMFGAYGLAITVDLGGSFWLGLVMAVLAPTALALLLGLPTLRLRTDYLAITTIAAAEGLRLLFRSSLLEPLTAGVFGIQQFADAFYRLNVFGTRSYELIGQIGFSGRQLWLVVVGWVLVAVAALIVWLLDRAPWGRVLRSIREDEDAARSLGKNVFAYKLQSLVIGGIFGGLGGLLLVVSFQNVNPDIFLPLITFFVYVVVILGGPGSAFGPIIGSVIFWFVLELTRGLMAGAVEAGYISAQLLGPQVISAARFVLVGLLLLGLLTFRPQGIFGNREEMILSAR
jgi:branched-chain amino acid transport system permease protein